MSALIAKSRYFKAVGCARIATISSFARAVTRIETIFGVYMQIRIRSTMCSPNSFDFAYILH